jgi:hypothetical protein
MAHTCFAPDSVKTWTWHDFSGCKDLSTVSTTVISSEADPDYPYVPATRCWTSEADARAAMPAAYAAPTPAVEPPVNSVGDYRCIIETTHALTAIYGIDPQLGSQTTDQEFLPDPIDTKLASIYGPVSATYEATKEIADAQPIAVSVLNDNLDQDVQDICPTFLPDSQPTRASNPSTQSGAGTPGGNSTTHRPSGEEPELLHGFNNEYIIVFANVSALAQGPAAY